MSTATQKVDVLARLRADVAACQARINDSTLSDGIREMYRVSLREACAARDAFEELLFAARNMMTQDQVRRATYESTPHMASAADRLSSALARIGGAA